MLNLVGAEMIAQPKNKYLFIRGMENMSFGSKVVISPGVRLNGSVIGDECNIGLGAVIENSILGKEVYVTANALVRNSILGNGSIVGANAVVEDTEIPPNTVVTGSGRQHPITDFKHKKTNRNVQVHWFDRNPMWNWTTPSKSIGALRLPSAVPKYLFLNHFPRVFKSKRLKRLISKGFCKIDQGADIHYTVILDPIFSEKISIGKDAKIERDCILLTHSFLGFGDYRLEHGPVGIGSGAKVGEHSVVVAGVDIPPDVIIPGNSVATTNGVYVVPEEKYRRYEEL